LCETPLHITFKAGAASMAGAWFMHRLHTLAGKGKVRVLI